MMSFNRNAMPNPPKNTRDFCIAEDFSDYTFFDAMADVSTPPEDLTILQTDYGLSALARDGQRIREYFRVAVADEGERQNRVTSGNG